jgi:hypothetical protein
VLPLLAGASAAVPRLCVPFSNATGEWAANTYQEAGCIPLLERNVRRAYGRFACQTAVPEGTGVEDAKFQSCLLDGRPLTRRQYWQLLASAGQYAAIRRDLPRVRALARCAFLDDAFGELLGRHCGGVKRDITRRARCRHAMHRALFCVTELQGCTVTRSPS